MENWKTRKPRKRGFDDDFSEPGWGGNSPVSFPASRPASMPGFSSGGPELSAVVKWYNSEKGFGFVEMGDGSGDAFLHASALQAMGVGEVSPGSVLKVRVGPGRDGKVQVTSVSEITEGVAPAASRPVRPSPSAHLPTGEERQVAGTVKWYNATKGFGFITPSDGAKDIFVHATALERSGMGSLVEGQGVNVHVAIGKKGPEASTLSAA